MADFTNFPNGLTSFGMPVIGGGLPPTIGTYFFVDSVTGAASNDGLTMDTPLATIDQAINKCTANKGDVIIVFPTHAETIASATSLVPDVAGVIIIGLGYGTLRPTLTFSATASRIPFSATNVVFSNIILMASVASIVSAVTVTGNDVILDRVEWNLDETGVEFLQMLDVDAALRVTVQNCKFVAENIAGTNTGLRFDVAHYLNFINNELRGDFTTAAISGTTGSAAASNDCVFKGNIIENRDTTAGILFDAHDNGTGLFAYNSGFTLYATDPESTIDPGDLLCVENYVVNAVNESGTIVPVTLST